jgi:formylglycine-generating enzyme required for sulfatase activity
LFYRSQDEGSDGMFTDNSDPATVSDFQLDTYLVTVGRFRQFVTAGLGTQQDPPAIGAGARMLNQTAGQGGWDPSFNASLTANAAALQSGLMCNPATTWTDAPGANESLPINCLTWFEAFAFCVWDGGFLPTEAEWNYAAAGGSDQLPYPWSNPATDLTIDCSHANFMNTTYCVDPPNGYPNAVGAESPIGDGKWGHSDLAGNVWEWTLDWYVAPYPNPCDDCANLTPATDRSIRGGSYNDTATSLRTPVRHFTLPTDRNPNTGVRCARTP